MLRRACVWAILTSAACCSAQDEPGVPYDSQKESATFPTAADALAKMELPPGFRATVFAAEPNVNQPIGFTTDERGRLWVVENNTYAESKLNFDTSLRDRIVILEDVDHDGKFDNRTVFWDQGVKLTSVEIGFGGVWVLAAPQMYFIPDANQDDVPDGPPEVLLDGWEDDVIRHNIVNGLRWGPDGWLYGRHGIQATSLVGPPGSTPSQRTPVTCGIWRYHPTQRKFEVVAAGGTNPWGFDFDRHGEMFMSNTVIGHLWHVVPGAHYRRMYGTHFNPHVYEIIEQTADHFHWDTGDENWNDAKKGELSGGTDRAGGGHAHCGLMIYQGDNWPRQYRNVAYMLNLHGRRVNQDRIVRRGNSYIATHAPDLFRTSDEWFRGIEMNYGPDGAVYVLDWSDIGECHENDGVHRSSGRIYRIHHGTLKPPQHRDLGRLSDSQLVALQLHENEWYVRKSRRLLGERAAAGANVADAIKRLLAAPFTATEQMLLRSMWCLHAMGHRDEAVLLSRLEHSGEHVRAWAVRLLVDSPGDVSAGVVDRFVRQARSEESGLVRLALASALNRLPVDRRLQVAAGLCDRGEDAADRVQPLMLWYGIEPAVTADPQRAVQLAVRSRIPTVRRLIARRLTAEIGNSSQTQPLMAALPKSSVRVQAELLTGMSEALRGMRQALAPSGWNEYAQVAMGHRVTRDLVRELGVVFGDGRALGDVKQIAADKNAADDARLTAIGVLAAARPDDLFAVLKPLVRDRVTAGAVVRALAASADQGVPDVVLGEYRRLAPDDRAAAIDTLVARPESAAKLLAAVEAGSIPASAISAFHARQIRGFGKPQLTDRLTEVWGEIRESPQDRLAAMFALREKLAEARSADPVNGRLVFRKTCANCHVLFGDGGNIGPDLTGSNRDNLSYLLENIIDPSASVAASFRMSTIVLEDGRNLSGVVLSEDENVLTLQTEKEKVKIPVAEIEVRKATQSSLMPDGLLKPLTEKQVRDLFAYLRSTSQVALPR